MLSELFLSMIVFGLISGQIVRWDDYAERSPQGDDLFSHCNESFCNLPCIGAKPPRHCPTRLPLPESCPTNCACMVDCERHSVTCFELQHCLVKKRVFTRRRKTN